jgi:ribosomal protein S18 acetylase RimI-like enzyme
MQSPMSPESGADTAARTRMRPLAAADIPRVAQFEREIARISFPEDPIDDLGFYERKLAAALGERKHLLLVLELYGEVVGWAWLAPRSNFVTKESYGDLRSFYIDARIRGTAAALRLMRACLDHCRAQGLKRMVGRTAATNEQMQALYRLVGFEPKHVTFELALDRARSDRAD